MAQTTDLTPVDTRIQSFLNTMLQDVCPDGAPQLPSQTLILDKPGLARTWSLPSDADSFSSPYLNSYRVQQGVLHNPKNDRRTTQGVFHVVEGGLPIPDDKISVPKKVFASLLAEALRPPKDVMTLPHSVHHAQKQEVFVSLLLRPMVCPATETDPAKSMEIRFFAPGTLISNLDFVETIFGNAGDPALPENDAASDVLHWTGHTGCVILAPHLIHLNKKALGLPHVDRATERQKRDGMCWADEAELYNGGKAFKVTCRNQIGVMVTIIADNYYGYCKKEVKTQISFAANLFGNAEEEHAGGALAYPAYILGQDFYADRSIPLKKTTFEQAMALLGESARLQPGRYAIDAKFPDIFFVPEDAHFHVSTGTVSWQHEAKTVSLPLRKGDTWILPSGYKVRLQKQIGGSRWRLIGTRADPTFCHKPCTVSGGGKSEISKSIMPMVRKSPLIIKDFQKDLDQVDAITKMDFSGIYRDTETRNEASAKRPFLSTERSLGSVIKLLTPSPEYTEEYNTWLKQLPQTLRQILFALKRHYQPEWGDAWRSHFSVDRINGYPGHELKFDNQKLQSDYLRVGFDPDGLWRLYKLRPDFHPADKVQMEDDITVSTVVPRESLNGLESAYNNPSVKLVANAEAYLFQRPDEAIHRGFDAQAEQDIATPNTFLSNFEPLDADQARALVHNTAAFDLFTEPVKELFRDFLEKPKAAYIVSSAHARIVDGKPSKNPRYLQKRPDLVHARETAISDIGSRLNRGIRQDQPSHFPVRAVLSGRRNNPANPKIQLPPLAVYNPIHYQEIPELMMDFLCSVTGKSPSTTGFGTEGALTKGPFNALWPVVDMNNAIVSAILTQYAGFSSAAGHIGAKYQIDHDISMLVPETWCRMEVTERDPRFLIRNGYLEKLDDLDYKGRRVPASRLGYRITSAFVDRFLGRIFETPGGIFPEDMLRPELQDLDAFVEGVESIVDAQVRVAKNYFNDGSVEAACPPFQALLHVLVHGHYKGMKVADPEFRALFSRESLLLSTWYHERLATKQKRDIALWKRHVAATGSEDAKSQLARVQSPNYLTELVGTAGADPFHLQIR